MKMACNYYNFTCLKPVTTLLRLEGRQVCTKFCLVGGEWFWCAAVLSTVGSALYNFVMTKY